MKSQTPKARLRAGTSLTAMRQKTRDALDREEEQEGKYGQRQSAAIAAELAPIDAAALAGFDEMVVLDALMKDPGCKLVAKMLKCSMESAAEQMLNMVKRGVMTIGVHNGQIRAGITKMGWQEVAKKLR